MTLNLELSPELEQALEEKARERGVELGQLALEALQNVVAPSPETARRQKVLKGYGMFANSPHGIEDPLRALHELDQAQQEKFERLSRMGETT